MRYPLAIASLILCAPSIAYELPAKDPKPTLSAHREEISQAIKLHDNGHFAQAIDIYYRLLRDNPDDVLVLHELAYSQFENKDYERCVATAARGAEYRSPSLARFYTIMANCQDDGGHPKRARKTFEYAIANLAPDPRLHFNYAVTLQRQGDRERAISALKEGIYADPKHASAHILLAQLYSETGRPIPSMLAAVRFLILAPRDPRVNTAAQLIAQGLETNVSRKDDGTINIFVSPSGDDSEGDFGPVETMLSILEAGNFLIDDSEVPKPSERDPQSILPAPFHNLPTVFEVLANRKERRGFADEYYGSYFAEADEKGHTEALCHYILQAAQDERIQQWLDAHREPVNSFLSWTEEYSFRASEQRE